jgi:actin-like ATPase involved in cell morphogenesis
MSQPINVGLDFGSLYYRAAYISDGQIIPVPTADDRIWSGNITLLQTGKDFVFSSLKGQVGTGRTATYAGRKEAVEDIILDGFRGIKRKIEEYAGEEVGQVAIAVPARYSSFRRAEILKIAEKAGFAGGCLINDSTAASLAYTFEHTTSSTLLVYSMGYSGYEISLLRAAKQNLREIAHEGDDAPAGIDFDHSMIKACINLLRQELPAQETRSDPGRIYAEQLVEINNQVSVIKQQLGVEETTTCTFSIYNLGTPVRLSFSQALFEELIADPVQTTMESVDRILDEANMKYSDVDKVLLVGGSTHINYIQRQLEAHFGPRLIQPRDDMLARGAAIEANRLQSTEHTAVSSPQAHVNPSLGKEAAPTFVTAIPTAPLEALETLPNDPLSMEHSASDTIQETPNRLREEINLDIESLFSHLHMLMDKGDYERVDELLRLIAVKFEDTWKTLVQLRQGSIVSKTPLEKFISRLKRRE